MQSVSGEIGVRTFKLSDLVGMEENAEGQTCTGDARLFRPALYYLSYLGNIFV